ncbi:MAG: oxygenase MpaB family protein, partial [Rhodoglobus sp.]
PRVAALYDTAMRVRELVYGPLDDEDGESLLADYAIVATALGVPRAEWPADRETFAAYWHYQLTELRVDASALRVAHDLLHPRRAPLWLTVAMPTARLVTAGLLDATLRAAYDLPFNEGRFLRLMRVTRAVYPRLPRWIRHAPMRHYLREFRR